MEENKIIKGFQQSFFEDLINENFLTDDLELALFISADGDVSEIQSNNATGYSRKPILFNCSEDLEIYNKDDIEFHSNKSWGLVKYLGIYKNNKLIYMYEIPMPKFIDKNCTLVMESRSIAFYLNNSGVF